MFEIKIQRRLILLQAFQRTGGGETCLNLFQQRAANALPLRSRIDIQAMQKVVVIQHRRKPHAVPVQFGYQHGFTQNHRIQIF